MKKLLSVMAFIVFFTSSSVAETEAGPRGGKLLQNEPPRAEVLIDQQGVLSIAFYDEAGKQLPPTTQTVTAVAEAPAAKTKMEFELSGELLLSKAPLPQGSGYNIVIQLKQNPDAKTENFRIKYNMNICGECKHPEYACTCDH